MSRESVLSSGSETDPGPTGDTLKPADPLSPGSKTPAVDPKEAAANDQPREPREPLSETDQIDAIADLIGSGARADEAGGGDDERAREPAAEPDAEPLDGDESGAEVELAAEGGASTDFAALAERLGIEPAELYEIEIPMSNGDPVTFGALKDLYQDRETAQAEIAASKVQLNERESAVLQDQSLFAMARQEMGQHMSPELEDRLRGRQETHDRFQRQQMLASIPEFADESVFANWREGAIKEMADYGYQAHEVVITDHRMVRMVRDNMRMKAELKRLANFKPISKPKPEPRAQGVKGRTGERQSKINGLISKARNGDRGAELSAISELIR